MTRGRLRSAIRIASIVAAIATVVSWTPFVERLERSFGLEVLYKLRGPLAPPPDALVIAIDRASLDWLRRAKSNTDQGAVRFIECVGPDAARQLESVRDPSSVPRSVYACLLDRLADLDVRLAVFDIMFSVMGPEHDDRKFVDSAARHGNVVMLVGFERSAVHYEGARLLIEQEVAPNQQFAAAASGTGSFVLPPVDIGVHGYFNRIEGMSDVRPIPAVAYERYFRDKPAAVKTTRPPSDSELTYFWHYGPPGAIRSVALWEVLTGGADDLMRSRQGNLAVFVGASDPTAISFVDSFPSYFGGDADPGVSGVELAATAFLNIMEGSTPTRAPVLTRTGLVAMFAFLSAFAARMYARTGYIAVFVILGLYLGATHIAFSGHQQILPVAAQIFVALPIALIAPTFVRYRVARRLINRLAPAQIGSRMLDEGEERRRRFHTGEATIVFTDIIGSTALAEKISPTEFNRLLSDYYDAISSETQAHRGLVSSFSGDGALLIFRRADLGDMHAVEACRAVLAIIAAVHVVNARNYEMQRPPVGLRVGINSGDVAEGDIGAKDRFNFSVVGDAVNLAARLERLGKMLFPGESDIILVGRSTFDLSKSSELAFLDCGLHEIPGRERRERVFRLR